MRFLCLLQRGDLPLQQGKRRSFGKLHLTQAGLSLQQFLAEVGDWGLSFGLGARGG